MKYIDLIATKGGHLVRPKDFVAPPSTVELPEHWLRVSGKDAQEHASLLMRAKKEIWTTHIVCIEPAFPAANNPPPPTLDSVLAHVGSGSTKESLGRFVKIVRTSWLSGSGAETVPCSEVGHELFVEERRSEVLDMAEERARKSRQKQKEKSIALEREKEEKDTSDEESANESDVS